VAGATTKEIAKTLGLRDLTIKSYLKSAHAKLKVRNVMELLKLFGIAPTLKHKGQGRGQYLLDQLRHRPRKKNECWLWPFRLHKSGYAYVTHKGKRILVHRAVLQIEGHPLPTAKTKGCHSCDVPACFNPLHLWSGTQKENIQDMLSKGRGAHQKKR
jgi:hypothetical protein